MKSRPSSALWRVALSIVLALPATAANWPAWRGPLGTGHCAEKNLPTKWSATENVKWRIALPEAGNSTPIVWGDRIFVTQPVGERRTLMCFNRVDGKLLWQVGVTTKEKEPTHQTNPYCSASPVTDGKRVIASFASDGLFCYDFDGKALWKRTDLGRQIHIWGGGVSPVIHGNLCFLNFGPGETNYLAAFDLATGKTVWKFTEETGYGKPPTPDVKGTKAGQNATYIGSWSIPVIMRVGEEDQLLMSWPRRLVSYDPAIGKPLWSCSGLNPLCYTSPIYGEGIVAALGGFNGMAIGVRVPVLVREKKQDSQSRGSLPTKHDDITGEFRLWHHPRSPQRIGSGVVKDGRIYIHSDPGTAQCIDLKTGVEIWNERLPAVAKTGQNWSSVMLAGDNCYTITQGGDCFVFKASPKFELVAVNPLGERSNSSIVPSNGELFIRTHQSLWCIAAKP